MGIHKPTCYNGSGTHEGSTTPIGRIITLVVIQGDMPGPLARCSALSTEDEWIWSYWKATSSVGACMSHSVSICHLLYERKTAKSVLPSVRTYCLHNVCATVKGEKIKQTINKCLHKLHDICHNNFYLYFSFNKIMVTVTLEVCITHTHTHTHTKCLFVILCSWTFQQLPVIPLAHEVQISFMLTLVKYPVNW